MKKDLKIFNEVNGFKVQRKRLFDVFESFREFERVKYRFVVNLIFIDEKKMASLNEDWKGKKGSTDVLSFMYEDVGDEVFGEIYICDKVAIRNALEAGVKPLDEIASLFAHGLLHLKGYTHETDEKYEKMMKKMMKIVGKS